MSIQTDATRTPEVLDLTADIVSAYVGRNQLSQSELTGLITSVHGTLRGLTDSTSTGDTTPSPAEPLVPAVPIDASVTEDAIICLEDGKPYKTLKRHLRTAYDMSPQEYRDRWGLSKDYPMVAPSYSAKRAATAKAIGLGRKPKGKGAAKKRLRAKLHGLGPATGGIP